MVLAALIVTSLGAGLCFAPALTLLSDIAESSRLHQGFAAGLSNMAWASGQVVGGVGGGVVASLTGYAAPSIAIAVLLLVTVAYAFHALAPGEQALSRADGPLGCAQMASGQAKADSRGWGNWAGDQACRPAEVRRPATATSWARRSPPPRRPGARSASPAPGTPSPRRR